MPSNTTFQFRERLLVAPLPAGPTKQFFHTRMESAMSLTATTTRTTNDDNNSDDDDIITPFPRRQVFDLLRNHNATEILIQVGTSSSYSFGSNQPLDAAAAEPWISSSGSRNGSSRSDLGPSGILIRATLRIVDESIAWVYWESLLHELVAQRILLAPLFSISIRRLHRHSTISNTPQQQQQQQQQQHQQPTRGKIFELILPTEGSSLSSEGMQAFTTLFSPCHNQSGIFHWNSPTLMSEFFLKRQSSVRHSYWIRIVQQQQQQQQQQQEEQHKNKDDEEASSSSTTTTTTTTSTTITKGMQFQPYIDTGSQNEKSITLSDLFPASTKHRRCPFVHETTLDVLKSSSSSYDDDGGVFNNNNNNMILDSRELVPKYWKDPFLTLPPSPTSTAASPTSSPDLDIRKSSLHQWSIHQMLQRPRGMAYSGRLITQVVVATPSTTTTMTPDSSCPLSVEIKWFLPPIVEPTWQSFRIIQEDTSQQQERLLDWRRDLRGSITVIDPTTTTTTTSTTEQQPFDDGTLYFRIPQWNVPTISASSTTQEKISLTISLNYRPAFLSFEHFPGDANRGVEIPPAQAVFLPNCSSTATTTNSNNTMQENLEIHLYSNSLLLLPPVPDMSMPFNVLSMTCSLYAFVIGALLNLLIRKSSERVQHMYDPSKIPPPSKVRLLIGKIEKKIVEKLKTMKKKNGSNNNPDTTEQVDQQQKQEINVVEEEEEAEETDLCKEEED